nr:amino acid ABC transporter ATP-binding protein [Nocardioides bruguierae]
MNTTPSPDATAAPGGPLLVVDSLTKSFGDHTVLRGVDLHLDKGEVVALIGPSGGGKSTLLRCINQLELPTSGQVTLDGTPLVSTRGGAVVAPSAKALLRVRRQIGMVFQSFNLFANMTAEQNIVFAQRAALGTGKDEARERARTLLERVGMGHKAGSHPSQLSGGQQQRVAIARSLALDPRVILFDEPTSAIDPEMRSEVLSVMRELAEAGMTMLVSTHEMGFAKQVSDRTVFLCDGGILEEGPSRSLLEQPTHDRTRQFLRAIAEG